MMPGDLFGNENPNSISLGTTWIRDHGRRIRRQVCEWMLFQTKESLWDESSQEERRRGSFGGAAVKDGHQRLVAWEKCLVVIVPHPAHVGSLYSPHVEQASMCLTRE